MPTGDSFVNLVLKRFLSQSRMNGNFLNYLQDMFYDGISRIFPNHGLFTYPSGLVNNGDGTFTVGTDPLLGTDGDGHVLKLTGASRNTNIPFEDTAATNYWIGMHYIEVPSGVQTNPRTGQVEYDLILEEIGELGNPTSAADAGGGTIKLVVDSILENGVDYSGREVTVWLTDPMSADAAVAFETLAVSYDGGSGENSVTTTGLLGQSSVSVAVADYQVAALGVTVKKSATNPWTSGSYCILGYVEGSSSNETLIDSNDLSGGGGHTLQKAYDGAGGAGDGRNVTVANEAIDLDQLNLTLAAQDVFHAPLRLTKDGERSVITNPIPTHDAKDTEGGIDILQRMLALYSYMSRVNLVDGSGSDFLRGSEVAEITAGPDAISLTRVGVDLAFTGNAADISPKLDYVQVVSSSNGNDGIYRVEAVFAPNIIQVKHLDGSTPVFTFETGTSMEARIYRPIFRVNSFDHVSTVDQASVVITNLDGFMVDYGGLGFHIPLKIIGAIDSDTTTPMISIDDYNGSAIFDVRYDGRIDARGLLDMNGNDIDTAGGDVSAGTGAIDGGNIDSQTDVTADSDANGTGDFNYGQPKSEWINISLANCIPEKASNNPFDMIVGQFWRHTASPAGAHSLYIPLNLPLGSTITDIRFKTYDNATIGSLTCVLQYHDAKFSAPTLAPSITNIAGTSVSSTAVGTWEVLSVSGLSIVVGAVADYDYVAEIQMFDNDEFGGMSVKVSYDTLNLFTR